MQTIQVNILQRGKGKEVSQKPKMVCVQVSPRMVRETAHGKHRRQSPYFEHLVGQTTAVSKHCHCTTLGKKSCGEYIKNNLSFVLLAKTIASLTYFKTKLHRLQQGQQFPMLKS